METPSFPSTSTAGSDAQSAPPELELDRICNEYAEWVVKAGKQLPPQWDMPDLVRTVIGEEAITIPLTDEYYDIMLHGANCWLCQVHFLDLINLETELFEMKAERKEPFYRNRELPPAGYWI